MTQSSDDECYPIIVLQRLIVFRRGKAVYDQLFHAGLNIIRGQNSSGKSTIADFIFYVLGGEGVAWKEEAATCEAVVAEVRVNGTILTLKRMVRPEMQRPMSIFWGAVSDALGSSDSGWQTFPYASKGSVESFSSVLFTALGFPKVRGELGSSLTMHQILRLLYADQVSQMGKLFRQDQFDKRLIREAVGAFLLGYFDARLYEAQNDLAGREDELKSIRGELRQMIDVIGSEDVLPTFFAEKLASLTDEHQRLYREAKEARADSSGVNPQPGIRKQYAAVSEQLLEAERRLEELEFQIADSNSYLESLRQQLEALDDSIAAREALGMISFRSCPSCGEQLGPPESVVCNLCKTPHRGATSEAAFKRMRQELALQIRESSLLQESRATEVDEIKPTIRALRSQRRRLDLELKDAAEVPTEKAVAQERYRKIGYIEREIEDLQKKEKLAAALAKLRDRRDQLQLEIAQLTDEISDRTRASERVRGEIKTMVGVQCADFLHNDLDREVVFSEARFVDFNFSTDSMSVKEISMFSASSNVILKNSFHLALLAVSLLREDMRVPKFLLLDNIEDKGMEEIRSRRFQRQIETASRSSKVVHQIIFTTSMIDPELERPEYVIGPAYSRANKTLAIP